MINNDRENEGRCMTSGLIFVVSCTWWIRNRVKANIEVINARAASRCLRIHAADSSRADIPSPASPATAKFATSIL